MNYLYDIDDIHQGPKLPSSIARSDVPLEKTAFARGREAFKSGASKTAAKNRHTSRSRIWIEEFIEGYEWQERRARR